MNDLWCIFVRGKPHRLKVAGADAEEAIDRWRRQTGSAAARSQLEAKPAVVQQGRDKLAALLEAAEVHGRESEPDHEVGDLRTILETAWTKLTPAARREVYDAHKDIVEEWGPGGPVAVSPPRRSR